MARDVKQAAKEFLTGVLGKLPEGDRAQVEKALAADAILDEIGNGVLRQSEFSQLMDQTQQLKKKNEDYYAELSGWHGSIKTELEELRGFKEKHKDAPPAQPGNGTPTSIDAKAIDEKFDAFGRDAVGFVAATQKLGMDHLHKFGEVLDLRPLLEDKRINTIGLEGVYNEVYKDKLAAKQKEAEDAREAKLRKEIEDKVRREFADKNLPLAGPVSTGVSPLDALGAEGGPKDVVTAAATEYARLQAGRQPSA